jgi:hypothetical protein
MAPLDDSVSSENEEVIQKSNKKGKGKKSKKSKKAKKEESESEGDALDEYYS